MKREAPSDTADTQKKLPGRYHCYDLFYLGHCDSLTCPKKHTKFENDSELEAFVLVYNALIIRDFERQKNPDPLLAAYVVKNYAEILEKSKKLKRVKSSHGKLKRPNVRPVQQNQGTGWAEVILLVQT